MNELIRRVLAALSGRAAREERACWVLLAGLMLAFGACKSKAERDKEYPEAPTLAELEEKVKNLSGIEQRAREREKLSSTALKLKKRGSYLCLNVDPPKDRLGNPITVVNSGRDPGECKSLVRAGPGSFNGDKIERCNDARYVVALKPRNLVKPVLSERGFNGGVYEYDALVYDFGSGKYKGGAVLTAESSDNVKASRRDSGAEDALLVDLLENACKGAEKAIDEAAQ